jgi:hypothetical protein
MPRQKSLITVIRDLVRQEISRTISSLLGTGKGKRATGRRRRRRRRRRGAGATKRRRAAASA